MQIEANKIYQLTLTGAQLALLGRALDGATFEGIAVAAQVVATAKTLQQATEVQRETAQEAGNG